MLTRRAILCGMAVTGALARSGASYARPGAVAAPSYEWATVPFGGGGFVTGFTYHPRAQGLLYARTDVGGAFRFDSAAKRWLPLLDHLGRDESELMGVLAIALDPADPDLVYLACGEYVESWAQNGAVLKSADRGRTWQKTSLGLKLGGNAAGRGTGERLQVDPNKGAILLLGTSRDGLHRSDDAGHSFQRVAGFPANEITLVLFDARSGKSGDATPTLFVGASEGKGKGGLHVSDDGGRSFRLSEGAPRQIPQRAVLDSEGNLYVTFSDGLAPLGGENGSVHRRDAKTGTWSDISPVRPGGTNGSFAYCALDIDPKRPGTVIAGTMNRWSSHDDLYLSRDGGQHWKAIGPNARHDSSRHPWLAAYLRGEDRMGHWIGDARIDPFDSDSMIYGTGYGAWMTHGLGGLDRGETVAFDFAVDNLEATAVSDMLSPSGGATLFVAMGDVGGAAYDDLTATPKAGLFLPTSESNRSVDCPQLAPKFVVRTSDGDRSGYYSHDGGVTWQAFPSSPRVAKGADGFHPGGRIAISARGGSLVWAPGKQPGYVSKDWGKSWTECQGWPALRDSQLQPVADRAIEGVFYIYDRGSQILISIDGGASFKPSIMGLPKLEGWQQAQLVATPGRLRDLWLAGPWGLFHSDGPDAKMVQVKGVDAAWLVCLGKAAPDAAYPAVYLWGKIRGVEGVFRSDDAGGKWIRINDDRHRYGNPGAMAADPLEYGTVYLAPGGRGVIMGRLAKGS